MPDNIFYHYGDMTLDVSVIFDHYMYKFTVAPDYVVGLSRGGLVPAVCLSHKFGVPLIPLKWSTRDFVEKDEDTLQKLIDLADSKKRLLIVDDIFDTGETFMKISEVFERNYIDGALPVFASLVTNRTTPNFPVFISQNILLTGSYIDKGPSDWLVFPWEN